MLCHLSMQRLIIKLDNTVMRKIKSELIEVAGLTAQSQTKSAPCDVKCVNNTRVWDISSLIVSALLTSSPTPLSLELTSLTEWKPTWAAVWLFPGFCSSCWEIPKPHSHSELRHASQWRSGLHQLHFQILHLNLLRFENKVTDRARVQWK